MIGEIAVAGVWSDLDVSDEAGKAVRGAGGAGQAVASAGRASQCICQIVTTRAARTGS